MPKRPIAPSARREIVSETNTSPTVHDPLVLIAGCCERAPLTQPSLHPATSRPHRGSRASSRTEAPLRTPTRTRTCGCSPRGSERPWRQARPVRRRNGIPTLPLREPTSRASELRTQRPPTLMFSAPSSTGTVSSPTGVIRTYATCALNGSRNVSRCSRPKRSGSDTPRATSMTSSISLALGREISSSPVRRALPSGHALGCPRRVQPDRWRRQD